MSSEPARLSYELSMPTLVDPYPLYKVLRDEDPAHYSEVEDIWVLTRFDDCLGAASNWEAWSSERRGNLVNDIPARVGKTLGTTDPPRHTKARRLVNRAFTPRTVADLEPTVRAVAKKLAQRARELGTFDYVQEVAVPLNASVLGAMFGVPPDDFIQLRHWLDDFFKREPAPPGGQSPQVVAMEALRSYIDALADDRAENLGDDLLSAMLVAEEDGERLSRDQVVVTTMTFLTAGLESVNNLLTNTVHALALHPDVLDKVRADLSLLGPCAEEVMRWDSPAQGFVRSPSHDLELHDKVIPEGAQVLLHFGAANRDERQFEDPDRFDLGRTNRRHLGLGHGTHFCVGAPLGRLMSKLAFEELLPLTRTFDIDLDAAVRVTTPNFRGFFRLDLAV